MIASVLSNGRLPVASAKIWEVGCGPGYVTLLLADKVGPSGKIIATDIDEDASRVAKKNIMNSGREDRVTFVVGDCRDFTLEPDPDDATRTVLRTPGGDKHFIDIIFIELPLLPYSGTRALSASENGYFEAVLSSHDRMLPPTLVKLLELVRHGRGQHLQLVLPVAGEGEDLEGVIRELLDILGSGWTVDRLKVAESGFIVPLHIHSGQVDD